jgi:hypothetical protein
VQISVQPGSELHISTNAEKSEICGNPAGTTCLPGKDSVFTSDSLKRFERDVIAQAILDTDRNQNNGKT